MSPIKCWRNLQKFLSVIFSPPKNVGIYNFFKSFQQQRSPRLFANVPEKKDDKIWKLFMADNAGKHGG